MSGDGAFIPEFQTRPSPLSNLQAQCFSLRNKHVPYRLVDEPGTFGTYQGLTGKKSEYPRGLFILLHSGEGGEQVKDSG